MPELLMPSKIVYGKSSVNKIMPESRGHIIIISDGGFLENHGFIGGIEQRVKRRAGKISTVINPNPDELYRLACEVHFCDEADCVIAVGGASVIDCGMLFANESGAEFIAVPTSSACAMSDFETGDYFSYRHSPDCLILDPQLMNLAGSGTVGYDGLSCLAYALDALCDNGNPIVEAIAIEGAIGIMENLVPAFRGNIDSLEKLFYSMYLAVAAHRNTKSCESSLLTRTAEFFSRFGYPKPSVCAVCIASIAEFQSDVTEEILGRIARELRLSRPDESRAACCARTIDELRKIQAALGIPRSISGFSLSPEDFYAEKNDSNVPSDLLDLCYYGSFKFVKL